MRFREFAPGAFSTTLGARQRDCNPADFLWTNTMTKKYTPRVAYEALLFAARDRDGVIAARLRDASR